MMKSCIIVPVYVIIEVQRGVGIKDLPYMDWINTLVFYTEKIGQIDMDEIKGNQGVLFATCFIQQNY